MTIGKHNQMRWFSETDAGYSIYCIMDSSRFFCDQGYKVGLDALAGQLFAKFQQTTQAAFNRF